VDLDATIKPTHKMTGDLDAAIKPVNRIPHFSKNISYQACNAPVPPMRRRRRSTQGDGDRYGSHDEIGEAAESNENRPDIECQVSFMAPPKRQRVVSHLRIHTFTPGEPSREGTGETMENKHDDELIVS
jgi:hypothetical protein